ncbi:MAG: response regulator [Candidatus Aminicenantes bacterium]|nr:response regulator [Candidatus Aminicenantes bacterium]
MPDVLKLLLVEESEKEATHWLQELKNCKYEICFERVCTKKRMISALNEQEWDIIIADNILPGFSGMEALKAAKKQKPDLPFIMISDKKDEQDVIETLKAGAQDYILKDRLFRLCPGVNQALKYLQFNLEKKKAEKQLQKMGKRFHLLAENITDVIWTMDIDRKFTFVSPSVTRVLGFKIDDLLGSTIDKLISPEDLKDVVNILDVILVRTKNNIKKPMENKDTFEMKVLSKSGKKVWMETKMVILYDNERNPSGFLGVSRDITERKQKDTEIALLALAVKQMDEGVVLTDSKGMIQYVNESFEKLSGITRNKLIGKPMRVLSHGSDPASPDLDILSKLPKNRPWKGQLKRIRTDDSSYMANVSLYPMKDMNGKLINYIYIERDITQDLNLQDKFVQMQKMEALGTLAGGIAHDFNNILMPIIVNSEMLLWDSDGSGPEYAYLNQILEAAQRGKALIKQILSFSRKNTVEKKTVDLVTLIKESLSFLQASFPSTIKIDMDIKVHEGKIDANPSQIQQVIMNLCTNAADALEVNGGSIKISLSQVEFKPEDDIPDKQIKHGSYLKFSVSDSGPGIDPDILDKIFDPFFSTKDPGKGSGMGLSVARKIIFDHNGTITLESQPKKGATFHVYFPLSEKILSEDEGKSDFLQGGSERILLVDDEIVLVKSVKNMLEKMGYSVFDMTSSHEALQIFKSRPDDFDLVISDQTMPDLTGIQLAQEINRIRSSIPLVLMTGFSEVYSPKEMKELGIDAYLIKPVSTKKLTTIIRLVLDKEK